VYRCSSLLASDPGYGPKKYFVFFSSKMCMKTRTKIFYSFLAFAVAVTAAGCQLNSHARFRMDFLPAAPHSEPSSLDLDHPPLVQPNVYLKDVPAFLFSTAQLPPRKTKGDILIDRAEARFEAGKQYYESQQTDDARKEFDAAIDSMLEAADQNPTDLDEYEQKMDRMVDAINRFDLTGLGASDTLEEGKYEKAPLEDILQMTFPVDPRLKDRVREQVKATVSQLPLAVNDTVLGYINYFSNRGHRTVVFATERSGRYRAMIQRILNEEGVPPELIHLAQAESGFMARAMSRARAGGMWQFLTWRGAEYGLTRTPYIDDRMDPEKATRAAARHLHDLYNEFGDWYLAIAAYNCGPGVVEDAVARTGYADFWELRNRGVLPLETTNYVPIILAMIIMDKNAAEYGLNGVQFDAPAEYDSITATAQTSLALVADITDTSLPELAALNPALLKSMVPANYSLHVPKGQGPRVTAALERVPAEHRNAWRMHRVTAGETLASIGKRFATAPASIAAVNKLAANNALEGQVLLIPAALRVEAPVRRAAAGATAHRAVTRHTVRNGAAPVKVAAATKPAPRPAAKPTAIVAGTR